MPLALGTTCCRCHLRPSIWATPAAPPLPPTQGLLMALAHPGTRVVGVSAVHGNAAVAAVGRNVARVLALCGAAGVPFSIGADKALRAPAPAEPSTYYGSDGLGDAPHAPPAADSVQLQPRPGHAAEHLARAARVRRRPCARWPRGHATCATGTPPSRARSAVVAFGPSLLSACCCRHAAGAGGGAGGGGHRPPDQPGPGRPAGRGVCAAG